MEAKDRERMQAEYDRLERWLIWVQGIQNVKNSFGIAADTPETKELLGRGYKRLEKIGRRLGIVEEAGIPWFQFYEMVREDIQQFLPAKYQDYKVVIEAIKTDGRDTDVLRLQKEGALKLPSLDLKEYTDRVADGTDVRRMLGRMANDYKKMLCPQKKHEMER